MIGDERDEKPSRSRLSGIVGAFWNTEEPKPEVAPVNLEEVALRVTTPPGTATPEVLAKLRADIGLDAPASPYRVFEGILQTLGDAIPDVALRYKKALQLAERQACTEGAIIQEFDDYKERIEQQRGILSATLDDLTRKKVVPKENSRDDIEANLTAKRQEVAALEAQLAEVERLIKAEEEALESVRANFTAAAEAITVELQTRERTFFENLKAKK